MAACVMISGTLVAASTTAPATELIKSSWNRFLPGGRWIRVHRAPFGAQVREAV